MKWRIFNLFTIHHKGQISNPGGVGGVGCLWRTTIILWIARQSGEILCRTFVGHMLESAQETLAVLQFMIILSTTVSLSGDASTSLQWMSEYIEKEAVHLLPTSLFLFYPKTHNSNTKHRQMTIMRVSEQEISGNSASTWTGTGIIQYPQFRIKMKPNLNTIKIIFNRFYP